MLVCVGMLVCVCCYYIRKIGLCSLRGLSFIAGTKREDPSVTKKLFSSSQKCYYELPLAFMYTVQALLWLERMFVLTRFNQKFFAWICRVSSSLVVLFSDIKKGFNIRKEIDETIPKRLYDYLSSKVHFGRIRTKESDPEWTDDYSARGEKWSSLLAYLHSSRAE